MICSQDTFDLTFWEKPSGRILFMELFCERCIIVYQGRVIENMLGDVFYLAFFSRFSFYI